MGRWKAWALAWLLIATLSVLLAPGTPAQGDELLVNGGFEDGVEGWSLVRASAFPVSEPLAPQTAGSQAIEFTGEGLQPFEIYQDVPVAPGEQYLLGGYYAIKGGQGVEELRLRIIWWYSDDSGVMVQVHQDDEAASIVGNPSYQFLATGPRMAQPPAQFARVKVYVKPAAEAPAEGAAVYLDDFSFTGPPAPTPTPSPTPSPTASPSPSPEPTSSPTPPLPSPSPTTVPTATQVPTPEPTTAIPSPTASSWMATPLPVAGLVNGGFEEADDEGKPLGWRKYGGELTRSDAARWEGEYAAAFISRTASTKWAFQTVAVQGGRAYILSGYALKNDANVEAAYLRLSWYASPDGSGQAIDSVDSTTRLTDDYPDFRFLTTDPVVAPAEAASAKVRLMLDPLSEAEGTVYFDAISFEETSMPSPTQTALPSPTQTAVPSARPEETATPPTATQTPLSPPSGDRESHTPSAVVPAAPVGEPQPSSSPAASHLAPTVLGASSAGPEATASSRNEPSRGETDSQGMSSRTPVVVYRERRGAESPQGGEGVAAGDNGGHGPSPMVLVLATALPAVVALGAGSCIWWRWKKRARPL